MAQDAYAGRGFTLAELMVVLAVLAVTVTMGVPAFAGVVERAREANTRHLLTASLMAARTAAVTRREPVTLCPSADGWSCRDDSAWEAGWIIFADPRRTGQPGEGGVLRRVEALGGDLLLRSTRGRPRVRYLPDGRAWGSNISFRLCDGGDDRLLGRVIVNNSGRARSEVAEPGGDCPA